MKYEDEITVEIKDFEKFKKIIEDKKFEIVERFTLNDTYFIRDDIDIKSMPVLDILKKCVIVRQIDGKSGKYHSITYKYKEYNENGDIVKQGKIDCEIKTPEDARQLFLALGYKELIAIEDKMTIYKNGNDEFGLQEVNGKHVYLEIEADENHKTIEELKALIPKYGFDIVEGQYFAKKAEVEFNERYS